MTNDHDSNSRPDASDFTGKKNEDEDLTETETETSYDTKTQNSTDELDGSELEPEESGEGGIRETVSKTLNGIPGRGNGNGNGGNGDYDGEDGVDDPDRRKLAYGILGFAGGVATFLGLDGADGEWDGNYEVFNGFSRQQDGTPTSQNETDQEPQDGTQQPQEGDPNSQNETDQEPPVEAPSEDEIYFNDLNDLPEGACYRREGGVSGYFEASDVEDILGEEATSGLTPSQGDIAYDVDLRDSTGDGQGDSYVIQLAGTNDQNDLTVEEARTLFNELELDGRYC